MLRIGDDRLSGAVITIAEKLANTLLDKHGQQALKFLLVKYKLKGGVTPEGLQSIVSDGIVQAKGMIEMKLSGQPSQPSGPELPEQCVIS